MLTFTAPTQLNTENLKTELEAVGFVLNQRPYVSGTDLIVVELDEADRAQAQAVLAAHTGAPSAEQQAEIDERDQIAALRAKARAVWQGTDTFTAPQVQKILAGLVLRATR